MPHWRRFALETFLRGMETRPFCKAPQFFLDLETFLRGMETDLSGLLDCFSKPSLKPSLEGWKRVLRQHLDCPADP